MSARASASHALSLRPSTAKCASSASRRRAPSVIVRASSSSKVVVLGGSGFVGSRVCEQLARQGCAVTSVSKSGARVSGADASVACDFEAQSVDDVAEALRGADVCVSCVGVIGTDNDAMRVGNGDINVKAIEAAKAAGVKRFVYVSVASVVKDVVGATPLMRGYFEGKTRTEDALAANFGAGNSFVVKPSFIYGGDAFSLTPPRVTKTYGDLLSKILGSGAVKSIAAKSPGPIKLTLAEPVSVDDVAGACVVGALGMNTSDVVDGTDDIKACAAALKSA